MNFIYDSKKRKLFASKYLQHSYQVSIRFWKRTLKELAEEMRFGIPYPPSKFAQAFDDLYKSDIAKKEIKVLPDTWED